MVEDDLMEDDLNGRRAHWKKTSIKDDLEGRQPQWKTTSIEDVLYSSNQLEINKTYNLTIVGLEERKPYFAIWKDERQPPWKMISMEDDPKKLKKS